MKTIINNKEFIVYLTEKKQNKVKIYNKLAGTKSD